MSPHHIVLIAIYVAAAAAFVTLLFRDAPYGRFVREGWGVTLSERWAWLVMEFPAGLSILVMMLTGPRREPVALVFFAAWQAHYVYRSLIYPFLLPSGRTKTMPLALIAMAIVYNCANGYVNGYHLFHGAVSYGPAWTADPRFVGGSVLFVAGAIIHISADRTLRRLRKGSPRRYEIPRGGLFRYVSCPNYLGEIVQWAGFALATWSLAGLSFAVFTVANLAPRALSHHRWYREHFPDYPADRRALIPRFL